MTTADSQWETHCKRAEAALAEMRKAFDGATPKELRRLRDLEARLAIVQEIAAALDDIPAHQCAGWDCVVCSRSSKAATLRAIVKVTP